MRNVYGIYGPSTMPAPENATVGQLGFVALVNAKYLSLYNAKVDAIETELNDHGVYEAGADSALASFSFLTHRYQSEIDELLQNEEQITSNLEQDYLDWWFANFGCEQPPC